MNDINIITYSAKAIVVTGNTKPIKDILKSAGGKFNPRLTCPSTHAQIMGWVFARSREQDLTKLLSGNSIRFTRVTGDNINDKNIQNFVPAPENFTNMDMEYELERESQIEQGRGV